MRSCVLPPAESPSSGVPPLTGWGGGGRTGVVATVLRAAGDDDPAVRRTALGTLGRWWPDRPEAFATVLRAAGDDDPFVLRTAVSVLAHRYADRSRRVLIELAAGTGDDDFRIYLVRVIALVWPDEPDARQVLEDQAAEGRSDRVRATARRALEYVHLRSSLGAEEGASAVG